MTSSPQFKIIVPLDNSDPSWEALSFASDLASSLSTPHKLILVHVAALNPATSLPGLDHLDKAANMDILAKSDKEVEKVRTRLQTLYGDKRLNYELVEVEGEGEVGPVIVEYVMTAHKDAKLVCVGSRNLSGLKKWFEGSVSGWYSWRQWDLGLGRKPTSVGFDLDQRPSLKGTTEGLLTTLLLPLPHSPQNTWYTISNVP